MSERDLNPDTFENESTAVRLFIELGRMPTRAEIFAALVRAEVAELQRQREVAELEKLFEL